MTVLKSLTLLAVFMAGLAAAPASAYTKSGRFDSFTGKRVLDRAAQDAGPLAPHVPQQVAMEEAFSLPWGRYVIQGSHGFALEALVLSRKDYSEGDMGALVPMDLALAWGRASDPEWIRHLRISQDERLYRWSYPRGTDIDAEEFARSSANMHMMPANDNIREQMRSIGRGDLVRITGYLVDITEPGIFEWKSSLSRNDTGKGACEIILIEKIEIIR